MREVTLLVKDDVTFEALQNLYRTTSSSAIELISVNTKSAPVVEEPVTKRYIVTFTGFDFELSVEVDSSDDDDAVIEEIANARVRQAVGHNPSDYSHETSVIEVVVL